jgi:microcystin-dependent protein
MSNFKIVDGLEIETGNNPIYQPGDICIYTSISVPQGWLSCDGQTYDPLIYPDLAATVGTYYGGGTQYRVPNMNATGLSYPNYVSATPISQPNYVATSLNKHFHALTSTLDRNTDNSSVNHTHGYNYNGNNETDDHRHEWTHQAAGGTAWSISGDVANYSTSGSAGGTAFRNHAHNHNGSTLNSSNVATAHSHTHAGNSSDVSMSHLHSYRTTFTLNSEQDVYPETTSVKFMVKI